MYRLALVLFLLVRAGALVAQVPSGSMLQTDQPVRLVTPTGVVNGSLLLPGTRGPVPVVLIIAGSGPTDRNGNTSGLPGQSNSLQLLAQQLATRGIASVRYDKRGVAGSAGGAPNEADLRFDTYVEDAAAWIRQLDADRRFSTVTVLGHSEGSLIGMLAARQAGADAFVSVAGIARRASEILRDQLRPKLPPDLWRENERILVRLEAGQRADSVPPALWSLYRPSVQPYVISWLRYTPTAEIARLSVPVLIVQGTTDVQVGVGEAEALGKARPDADLVIVNGMNHVLKEVPADPARQQASYLDPSLPVVPELAERVAAFVKRTTAGRSPG
jgi:pimeloyl-ACP methyl ester carboxylesterase